MSLTRLQAEARPRRALRDPNFHQAKEHVELGEGQKGRGRADKCSSYGPGHCGHRALSRGNLAGLELLAARDHTPMSLFDLAALALYLGPCSQKWLILRIYFSLLVLLYE